MSWTMQQIESMARALAPSTGWHKCETCKVEYHNVVMAYNCWKAHRRSHERVFDTIDTREVKHQVSFDGDKPLCRACTTRAESSLTIVQMATPPNCSRCGREIRDPAKPDLTPPILPPSERFRDILLQPSREALVEIERARVLKANKKKGLSTSGSAELDARNQLDYGAQSHHVIKKGKPLQCRFPIS